jgi:hypothetical protein
MTDAALIRWTSLQAAADVLGMTPGALRKILERHARRGPDGVTEAQVNGVRARKLGRLWRVRLSAAWIDPELAGPRNPKHAHPSSQSVRKDREGPRS